MQNRILIIFIIGLLFFGGLFFFNIASRNIKFVHPIQEIPLGAELIIQFPNYYDFSKSYKNTNEFIAFKGFILDSSSNIYINSFDSLFFKFHFKDKSPCVFSVYRNGAAKYVWLFAGGYFKTSYKAFKEYLFSHFHNVNERKYNGVALFSSNFLKGNEKFDLYFSIVDNNLIVSPSEILIESSIRQSGSDDKITHDKYFSEIYATSGKNVAANLFINYSHLLFSQESDQIFSFGRSPGYWGALDLVIKDKILFLNGFTSIDSTFAFSQMISDQKPVKFSAHRLLPVTTLSFNSVSCSRKIDFKRDLEALFSDRMEALRYKKLQDTLNQFYGTQLLDFVLAFAGDEITTATALDQSGRKHEYVLIQCDQIQESFIQWKLLFDEAGKLHHITTNVHNAASVGSVKFQILESPLVGIAQVIPGSVFTHVQGKYLFCCNKFIVFTDSISSAEFFMESYLSQQTLLSEAEYNKLNDNLSSSACYQKVINFRLLHNLCGLTTGFLFNLDKVSSNQMVKNISWVGLQTNRERKNLLYSNAVVQFMNENEKFEKPLWKLKLDTIFNFKPKIFKNPVKNNLEIFLQDLKNTIYFIQSNGDIIWKRRIQESIMGEVYPIDYYRNGKIQFLFNTRNYIWLVDRNGNNVEGFPVKLNFPSTNSILVIDYEKNKNYRLFIACADKKIHLYDKGGKEIMEWKSPKLNSKLNSKIQYFSLNSRDYIICYDSSSVYILDRKGNSRIKIKDSILFSRNCTFWVTKYKGKPCFACTDERGQIQYIFMNGDHMSKKVGEFSPDHHFLIKDFNSDGKDDLLFCDQNAFSVYNSEGKALIYKRLTGIIKYEPLFLSFSDKSNAIGLVLGNTHQIFLFDFIGNSVFRSFIFGNTQFSIDRLEKGKKGYNLLTGDENGYLLNYYVEN